MASDRHWKHVYRITFVGGEKREIRFLDQDTATDELARAMYRGWSHFTDIEGAQIAVNMSQTCYIEYVGEFEDKAAYVRWLG